ncbi:serine/threonine protein kinase, partial [Oscillatoriales cyanobacterium LEGE 11467]|nr:serine/threonine protein kinase [Zarconia navalis LEGE 11467]
SFYFLADSAFGESNRARKQLQRLKAEGYEGAGMFWLPDYPNLSGKSYTQVYAATFDDRASCAIWLKRYGRENPDAYCALASTDANLSPNPLTAREALGNSTQESPNPDVPDDRPSPEQAIRSYYETLNGDRYRTAWGMLSKSLQRNRDLHPNGYSDYSTWWDSVDFVEIEQISPMEVDRDSARVGTQLKYHMKTGNISPLSLQIELVWDDRGDRWLYNGAQVD